MSQIPSDTMSEPQTNISMRVETIDWGDIAAAIGARGFATVPGFLAPPECAALIALDARTEMFRKRIDMARHNFGEGAYGYFAEPIPPMIATMRQALYPPLVPIANQINERLGRDERYPATLAAYRRQCAARGQSAPTPLLLRYDVDGYNRLHQDVYGPEVFPLQGTVLLSRPGRDFSGGAFLLTQTMPRQQTRGEAVELEEGTLILFAGGDWPAAGKRGFRRASIRHGVSTVTRGCRHTLGLIFHDAA